MFCKFFFIYLQFSQSSLVLSVALYTTSFPSYQKAPLFQEFLRSLYSMTYYLIIIFSRTVTSIFLYGVILSVELFFFPTSVQLFFFTETGFNVCAHTAGLLLVSFVFEYVLQSLQLGACHWAFTSTCSYITGFQAAVMAFNSWESPLSIFFYILERCNMLYFVFSLNGTCYISVFYSYAALSVIVRYDYHYYDDTETLLSLTK